MTTPTSPSAGVAGVLAAGWRNQASAYLAKANEKDSGGSFRWAVWMRDELRAKAGLCNGHADEIEAALGGAAPATKVEAKPAAFAVRDHSDGKFWMVDLDERHASRQAELNDDTLVPLYDHAPTPAAPRGGEDAVLVNRRDLQTYTLFPAANLIRIAEALEFADSHPRIAKEIRDMVAVSPGLLPATPAGGGGEAVAEALWHRFGDDSRLTWDDEPEKAIYRDAAAQVIATIRRLASTGSAPAPSADTKRLDFIAEYNWIGTKTRAERGIEDSNPASLRQAIDAAMPAAPTQEPDQAPTEGR